VTTTTFDLHCHFIPPSILDRIEAEGASHGVRIREDGTVSFAERDATQALPAGMLDLDERLAWMDDQGVDVQILSAWMDFSAYVLPPEDGAWLARSLNELTADEIASHSDRFRAMAAVPLQAPDLAADELRRAVEEIGFAAVEIGTAVVDRELDHPSLDPFWRAAEELDVLVLVHPYAAVGSDRLTRYFMDNVVGNPAEETIAAAHLLFGGVLERYPRLKICLTHGGGFLPYQIGRQDRAFESKAKLTTERLHSPPSTFLRSFYYDTVVHGRESLRFLVERVGADRVVLGSDYPFPMGDPHPVATVRAAGLGEVESRAVLGDNAVLALNRRVQGAAGAGHSLLVHEDSDDVGVAVVPVGRGREVIAAFMASGKRLTLEALDDVPLGHKIALRDLDEGAQVLKYGIAIGRTSRSIRAGNHVHTHNLRTIRW
jgi:aminocarboxymuconate-semialdehyde decarboxylase